MGKVNMSKGEFSKGHKGGSSQQQSGSKGHGHYDYHPQHHERYYFDYNDPASPPFAQGTAGIGFSKGTKGGSSQTQSSARSHDIGKGYGADRPPRQLPLHDEQIDWVCLRCNSLHPWWHRTCFCGSQQQRSKPSKFKSNRWSRNKHKQSYHGEEDQGSAQYDADMNYVDDDVGAIAPPPLQMVEQVLQWMTDKKMDDNVIQLIKQQRQACESPPPPFDEVKALQSAKDKLRNYDKQLDTIGAKVVKLQDEVQTLVAQQDELKIKRAEAQVIFDKYSKTTEEGDTLQQKVNYYEALVRDIQVQVEKGLPSDNSAERKLLYKTIFGGTTTGPTSCSPTSAEEVPNDAPPHVETINVGFGESGFVPVGPPRASNKFSPYVAGAPGASKGPGDAN